MADFDPTDRYRFENEDDAIEFAQRFEKPCIVIKLSEAKYSDKPYMVVLQEWITSARRQER
jgi:hypothetical protein